MIHWFITTLAQVEEDGQSPLKKKPPKKSLSFDDEIQSFQTKPGWKAKFRRIWSEAVRFFHVSWEIPPKSSSVQDLRPKSRPKAPRHLSICKIPFTWDAFSGCLGPKVIGWGVEASMEGFTNKHAAELWKLGGSDSLSLLKMGQYIQIYNIYNKLIYSLFIGLPPNDAEGRFWWGDDNMCIYIYIYVYIYIYYIYICIYIYTYIS